MTREDVAKLPDAQRLAFFDLWLRSGIKWEEYLRNSQAPSGIFPYVGVSNFHGMFVGIEPDGHTHS
jgi:hypothetical protein